MAATTSAEEVKCVHCDKILGKKNLRDHTQNAHGEDVKVEFVSVSSSDIRSIFGTSPPKLSKNNEESLNVQGETTSDSASAESSKLNTFDNDEQTKSIFISIGIFAS